MYRRLCNGNGLPMVQWFANGPMVCQQTNGLPTDQWFANGPMVWQWQTISRNRYSHVTSKSIYSPVSPHRKYKLFFPRNIQFFNKCTVHQKYPQNVPNSRH